MGLNPFWNSTPFSFSQDTHEISHHEAGAEKLRLLSKLGVFWSHWVLNTHPNLSFPCLRLKKHDVVSNLWNRNIMNSPLKVFSTHYVIKNAPSCIKVMKVGSPSTTLSFKKSYKIFHDYKHHNSNTLLIAEIIKW